MPDLDALHLLRSVGRLGSLGAAAAEHGISQPAASSRIRYMERLVGLPLLVRGARGSALTEEGTLLAGWARDLLLHAAVIDEALAALRFDHETSLRIAASTTIAEHLLPAWLAEARARASAAVVVQVLNSRRVMDVVLAGRADLGFVVAPNARHGLSSRVVATDHLVVVVGRDHAWAVRREPVGDRELARTPLLHREVGSGTRESVEAALAHVAPLAGAAWEATSTCDLLVAAARGLAPAVVSELALGCELDDGRLVRVQTTGVRLRRELRAVWPLGQPLGRAQRDFLAVTTPRLGHASRLS